MSVGLAVDGLKPRSHVYAAMMGLRQSQRKKPSVPEYSVARADLPDDFFLTHLRREGVHRPQARSKHFVIMHRDHVRDWIVIISHRINKQSAQASTT